MSVGAVSELSPSLWTEGTVWNDMELEQYAWWKPARIVVSEQFTVKERFPQAICTVEQCRSHNESQ